MPRDAGHRGQRVLSRLSGRERGTFASRLVQFAITRVAVPRRANGPDPEPPLGVHEHESSGDRREHPLTPRVALPCRIDSTCVMSWRVDPPAASPDVGLFAWVPADFELGRPSSSAVVRWRASPSARVARRRPGERRRARRRSGLADEEKNFSCRGCTRRPMGHPPGSTTCTAVRGQAAASREGCQSATDGQKARQGDLTPCQS